MKRSLRELFGGYEAVIDFVWMYLIANAVESSIALPCPPHNFKNWLEKGEV